MPFCTGCGVAIESGQKCENCIAQTVDVSPVAQFSQDSQGGMGNWLNEMFSTLKKLVSGHLDNEWVVDNSQASIWGAIATSLVLTGIVAILMAKITEQWYWFWFSEPKIFFLGLFGMAVFIVGLFGTLYIIFAIGKSKASPWDLLGLAAYAGLLFSLLLLLTFIGTKISNGVGFVVFICGLVSMVQIMNHGLNQLSDLSRSVTFYAVPIATAVILVLLYVYVGMWINW